MSKSINLSLRYSVNIEITLWCRFSLKQLYGTPSRRVPYLWPEKKNRPQCHVFMSFGIISFTVSSGSSRTARQVPGSLAIESE
jgi:hypothetical protein